MAIAAVVASTLTLAEPATAESTWTETVGGPTHTWTNSANAGGQPGQVISSNGSVQVSCYVQGMPVADSNPDWYRIASSPWNDTYYASADAFYNNGSTSGSLKGTPWVDPAVPVCGSGTPAPPSPSVTLSQGPVAPQGYRYAVSISNFAANSEIPVECYDSTSPGGFYSFTLDTDGSGSASTSSQCYSGDGPDHWVVAGVTQSNHVSWSSGSGGSPSGGSGSTGAGSSSGGGGSTGGGSPSGGSTIGGSTGGGNSTTPVQHGSGDPCITRYGAAGGVESTHSIFGGSETDYPRAASLYQVCEGFGAGNDVSYSPEMKCALIAAAAVYVKPPTGAYVSNACDALGYADDVAHGNWLGAASSWSCGFLSDVFATGAGIFAAGEASETGPGAVAVGTNTYKALDAYLQVACGGLLDGGASTLGQNNETDHEASLALAVEQNSDCLQYRRVFGYVSWSVASC